MAKAIWENKEKLFVSSPDKGLITETTGNIIIATIVVLFLLGLFFMPSDAKSIAEGYDKIFPDKRKKAVKDPKDKFRLPAKGGSLQNLPKNSDDQISLKLREKTKVSDDTFVFKFDLNNKEAVFGLPIGKHVVFSAEMATKDAPGGEEVERKYTPISTIDARGHIDFLIKVYR
jgi:ribosomal protein L9